MPEQANIDVLREEFAQTEKALLHSLDDFEKKYDRNVLTDHELRIEFGEVDYNVKRLLALLRYAPLSYDNVYIEHHLVRLLANLEIKPVKNKLWRQMFNWLKVSINLLLQKNSEFAPSSSPHYVKHEGMYVSGVDRVTEGEEEMDFDIPEASLQDQVRDEIDDMVTDFFQKAKSS